MVASLAEEERLRILAEKEAAKQARRKELRVDRRGKRAAQVSQIVGLLNDRTSQRLTAKANQVQSAKWSKYLACEAVPEPSDPKGVATYLSVWRDEVLEAESFDPGAALLKCEEASELARSVDELGFALDDAGDYEGADTARELARSVRGVMLEKLDYLSAVLFQYADKYSLEPGTDLLFAERLKALSMFAWGNITKDPALAEAQFKTSVELEEEAAAAAAAAAAAEEAANSTKKSRKKSENSEETAEIQPKVYTSISVAKGLNSADVVARVVQLRENPFVYGVPAMIAPADEMPDDDFGGEELIPGEESEPDELEEGGWWVSWLMKSISKSSIESILW